MAPFLDWLSRGWRPASLGFGTVEIAPQLGPLTEASGRLVHPAGGEIEVAFRIEDGGLHGNISLPMGLTGTLRYDEHVIQLSEGMHRVALGWARRRSNRGLGL